MDSLISAAARALAAGDALGALKRVALRDDPPALALRGIAMAQIGEHLRARELLKRAERGFGAHEEVARARCVVAEAEVALAMRDLGSPVHQLGAAAAMLEAHDDRANALHARLVTARRLLLLGCLKEASSALGRPDIDGLPPSLVAATELAAAELALRSLAIGPARAALDRAQEAAERARVPALLAEVAEAREALQRPAARRITAGGEQTLCLEAVAALQASGALVVDACHHGLRAGEAWRPLVRRPVLFALARMLAAAWPGDVDRQVLIAGAFGARKANGSDRARLRVEIGRLRAQASGLASIVVTARGFALRPHGTDAVAVLAPPVDGAHGSILALLADGSAWSTSDLALSLGVSQRTLQRALAGLEAAGQVRSLGRARTRRWLAPPLTGFTTTLLLPAALSFT